VVIIRLVRRWVVAACTGAVPLAMLTVVAQATRRWRDQGCAGVGGSRVPPCDQPAFWHWADVEVATVVVAAVIGAGIGLGLWALARRERTRRQLWGES